MSIQQINIMNKTVYFWVVDESSTFKILKILEKEKGTV